MQHNKNHYRKVFKSDHLGCADLEDFTEQGNDLIFTIKNVRQEMNTKVAGKNIDANIAYFKESIKPLVLNSTNSKVLKKLTGSPFVEDWSNITVQLYIDAQASLMGTIVGGVRISPNRIQPRKPNIIPDNKKLWDRAIAAYKRDGNFNAVLEHADISKEYQNMIKAESEINYE